MMIWHNNNTNKIDTGEDKKVTCSQTLKLTNWGNHSCVSVCVCLTAIICPEVHFWFSPHFLCLLSMAVARSSTGGIVICYTFPVWWITSYLHKLIGCSTSPLGWGSEAHIRSLRLGAYEYPLQAAVAQDYLQSGPSRPQWACWIFVTCLHVMSMRI